MPRSGRGCFGAVVALPLALIGLGGVLSLVLLQGEQPGEQASGEVVQATSRPTLVSAHRSEVAVPTSSDTSVEAVPEEVRREERDAVRSGPGSVATPPPAAAPAAEPSTVEDRRRGERSHRRHHPDSAVQPPSATSSATAPPTTTAPEATPTVEPAPTTSVTPDPTPDPVPPTSSEQTTAPAPESTPATG
jgi:hypothetical protein